MKRFLPLVCALALLTGCAGTAEPVVQTFFAMDTVIG